MFENHVRHINSESDTPIDDVIDGMMINATILPFVSDILDIFDGSEVRGKHLILAELLTIVDILEMRINGATQKEQQERLNELQNLANL